MVWDQDPAADFDILAPGQQPDRQVGDIFGVERFFILETSRLIVHIREYRPGTNRADPDVEFLVLALDILGEIIQRMLRNAVDHIVFVVARA